MATNNSSAPGYLAPLPFPAPLEGEALEDVFNGVISGITGIVGSLVRPRWQPDPPNQPDFSVNWVAFGITTTSRDVFAFQRHDATLNANIFERDEVITILHSFYGPDSQALMDRFTDGIQVEQNRDELTQAGIKLVECQEVGQLPALLKEKWVRRQDCRVVFRRRVFRAYPILTAVANTNPANGGMTVDNEHYITHINPSTP